MFKPKHTVQMLICGPTVYDCAHVGHARVLLFYDLIARYVRFRGAECKVVLNITDIDPKIFAVAKAQGKPPEDIATFYVLELLRDMICLGIDDFALARVSDYAWLSRELVKRLLDDGKAYNANGNVYLDAKQAGFGKLSKMTTDELSDCRLDIAPGKRSPFDVLIWNSLEDLSLGFADRVLGSGIPWWHMQDTSVAIANFAGSYDLHGGADELIYPHHESHLAQLVALTLKKTPVKLWTHVGLVYFKGEKMSKSLGNTLTIREILQRYGANALRLYLYSLHYRKQIDFSTFELSKYVALDNAIASSIGKKQDTKYLDKFLERLEDDFDTEGAIEILLKTAKSGMDAGVMAELLGLRY